MFVVNLEKEGSESHRPSSFQTRTKTKRRELGHRKTSGLGNLGDEGCASQNMEHIVPATTKLALWTAFQNGYPTLGNPGIGPDLQNWSSRSVQPTRDEEARPAEAFPGSGGETT